LPGAAAAPPKTAKLELSGYMQFRYNRLLETNPDLRCEQCDRSWGAPGGFSFRRIRIRFAARVHPRVYVYIQPDFASDGPNLAQICDAYMDIGLDDENQFRFRLGQSKIPYSFESMQSSQRRLPLDRNDALNSSHANERDLGVIFFWTPPEIRKLFSRLTSEGLKGSGNYGVAAFGVYNGQLANQPELNDNPYWVARLCYPFQLGRQIWEPTLQAYTGRYMLEASRITTGVAARDDLSYVDQRVAVSSVLYPQPFGLQAEWNWGQGPEYDPQTNSIGTRPLHGGYVLASYRMLFRDMELFPFVRWQYYDGGKKHERDARSHEVQEWEFGVEFQPYRALEIVVMWTHSARRFEDGLLPQNFQRGSLLRFQFQANF
jgi:hypothetical protein